MISKENKNFRKMFIVADLVSLTAIFGPYKYDILTNFIYDIIVYFALEIMKKKQRFCSSILKF